MMHFVLTWLGTAVSLLITAHIVPGLDVTGIEAALVAAVVIGLINAIIRPILSILTFPINLLTFGLFTFVVNGFTLWLATIFTPDYGFTVRGPLAALFGSIVLAIVSSVINYFLRTVD